VKVELKTGQAVVRPAERKSFDPTQIAGAIKDAGFDAGEIELTVVGTLGKQEDFLLLELSGAVRKFVLAGGAKAEELEGLAELLGKRLRVTGKLHPSHADRPPGLTVERWHALQ
jgi:hypothetical protein